jgi:hypothetical protein
MNYAFKMGYGAMIYIQSFIKIGSGVQKLIILRRYTCGHREIHTHTHRQKVIA